MDIFIMHYNYRNKYLVVIIDTSVYVYKQKICKFDPPLFSFQARKIFIGKSKICLMTEVSGAGDKIDFDGNTLLIECENDEYVYISGLEIIKFKTEDKLKDYISLMGNNMTPYAYAIGEKYTYFIYHRYKFIEYIRKLLTWKSQVLNIVVIRHTQVKLHDLKPQTLNM